MNGPLACQAAGLYPKTGADPRREGIVSEQPPTVRASGIAKLSGEARHTRSGARSPGEEEAAAVASYGDGGRPELTCPPKGS